MTPEEILDRAFPPRHCDTPEETARILGGPTVGFLRPDATTDNTSEIFAYTETPTTPTVVSACEPLPPIASLRLMASTAAARLGINT